MNKVILTIILIVFSANIIFAQTELKFPQGWLPPESGDYFHENLQTMDNIIPCHVEADFDGDGFIDHCWMLLNKTENKLGLFTFLGQQDKHFKTIKLIEYPKETDKLYMGINLLNPGQYKTACGKGYWKCEMNEPELLILIKPGIDFFAFESAHSVFYWNSVDRNFKRIWLSD